MADWSISNELRKGQQDPLWGRALWSQQSGGFTGMLGRAPAHLSPRKQPLANNEAARCSTNSRPPDTLWPAEFERGVTSETVSTLCQRRQLAEAVEALGALVLTDSDIAVSLFYAVLKECVAQKNLSLGRRVHALTVKKGYEPDTFLCTHVLRMYASHDRLHEALDAFDMVVRPDAFTWSAIISAHVKGGQDKQAIELYHRMRWSGVEPDGHVFVAALQACARGADLVTGQQVHADVLASRIEPNLFVSSCLVDMYAKCGSLEEAQRVFDGLPQKDVVTWNAMISGYAQQGMGQEALRLYSWMEGDAPKPNAVTFVCLLQACASLGTLGLAKGKQIHGQIRERGLQADVVVGGSLVNMYAKCGSIEDARCIFDGLSKRNVVTWNSMIAGYTQQGLEHEALRLYQAMQEEGIVPPDAVTFVCLLQACASVGTRALEQGRQVHAQIRERGLQADVFVASSLVNMYAKAGSLRDAKTVFDGLGQKNVVTWCAMIAGYCQEGMGQEALCLYDAMQEEGIVTPNSVTFTCLLQACATVGTPALEKGRQLHAEIKEQGFQGDVSVSNSLVNMYAKCGSLGDAQGVFDGLGEKNVVTWNAMIAGYSQQGRGMEALGLYRAMQEDGIVELDSVTFVCLLQACASLGTSALEKGRQLHAQIREQGLQGNPFVASSLVNMYARCGSLEDARGMFDGLLQRDVVTWSAMIAGYSQQGMGQEALRLYRAMQEGGISALDSVTCVSILQACASVGAAALGTGKQIHSKIRQQGLQAEVFVASSLVNMYSKCGSLEDAHHLFDALPQKDVVTWNAMVAGYSQAGMALEALGLYRSMCEEGFTAPNSLTFVCVLQACANVAALHLGRQLHAQIKQHGLQADVLVASSLINMYGKCGSMGDAQQVFDALPERDVATWNALIAGYTHLGDSEEVFVLVRRMIDSGIQPDSITFLNILTVCSHTGLVNLGREYFKAMSERYGISPTADHYTGMVDLLSRAGQLEEALVFMKSMPILPDAKIWHTLLGACQKWSNVEVGRHAFHEAMKLDKKDAAAYVLMSNIYTSAQMWQQAVDMQARREGIGARKEPGQSCWTDMDGLVHRFVVRDKKRFTGDQGFAKMQKEGYLTFLDSSPVDDDGEQVGTIRTPLQELCLFN